MRSSINTYVAAVLENIAADEGMKKRIEKDLIAHINEACAQGDEADILDRMGAPEEVAREFMDNIYENKEDVIEKLVQERALNDRLMRGLYEYKSKAALFGLPLLHIKVSNRYYGGRMGVAKGIIAIGNISMGVLSLGGIALGGICFGGVSLGLVSLAGISLGLLLALGGVAVGSFAVGGLAVGFGAIGGAAFGKIAYGGFAKGVVAIGGKAVGKYIISGTEISTGQYVLGEVRKEEIESVIRAAYPNISSWIVKLFSALGA
ncbi:MAG: transcriptional regulator, family protein [Clostridia bacterium]|jgi:uncharacterized membrane protein|nr:transcriptional regulator, family protein [Clostridia bacterium]